MHTMDDLFTDALRKLLADQCTPQLIRDIESGQPAAPLWQALESSGFADALLTQALGGAGLQLCEVFPLMELCGTYVLPVPMAETMLARALLTDAGLTPPQGSITFAWHAQQVDGSLVCMHVSNGRVADWVLLDQGDTSLLLPVASARLQPAVFALDASLTWNARDVASAQRLVGPHDLRTLMACICATLMSGTLMAVFNRTLQFANERSQFGRPIGKFQAIQHQLSVMSEHTFAARMAAQIGCHCQHRQPDRLRVAVAKARTSEAALEVASLSHSIHGAIGFTHEFDLQLFTRRLHAWRLTAGSESYWHTVLGEELVDHREGLALDLVRATSDMTYLEN
jgi:acyl-CoA dehydrogenase